jgi:hypothetical protein
MAKELKITSGYKSVVYDNKKWVTEKVVDVTEDCPNASNEKKCLFLYLRMTDERIIQIRRPYKNHQFSGAHINFRLDQLEAEMRIAQPHNTFALWAEQLGLTGAQLRDLIETHAPPL